MLDKINNPNVIWTDQYKFIITSKDPNLTTIDRPNYG